MTELNLSEFIFLILNFSKIPILLRSQLPLHRFGCGLYRRACSAIFVFEGIMCVHVLLNQTWQMVM